ncbi:MAG: hypothetical protein V1889_00560 [archaeon]
MLNKKGVLGEGILMMYRLALVTLVAFIVLGVSSVFYAHYIDVRDAEAVLMTRNIVDCVAPLGVVDLDLFGEGAEIFSYCGFSDYEVERFYAKVSVSSDGRGVAEFSQGDSGALWVRRIFDEKMASVDILKYEPGYSSRIYDVIVLDDFVESYGKIEVEVLVNEE